MVEEPYEQPFPPTVTDTERHDDGMTLITIDTDPGRNIEVYEDDRRAHFSEDGPEITGEE